MDWRALSPADAKLERRTWPEGMRDDFEERAAIKESMGRMTRAMAEAEAFAEVIEAEESRREAENRRFWAEADAAKAARRPK